MDERNIHGWRFTVAELSVSLISSVWTMYGGTIPVIYIMSFRNDRKSGNVCANNEQDPISSSGVYIIHVYIRKLPYGSSTLTSNIKVVY